MRHRRMHHKMKMRHMAGRRGRGRGFGPSFGGLARGEMMSGFLAENPDCAEKMARYGVKTMLEEGFTRDEVRDHLTHLQEHGFMPDLNIDGILDA
ncbi:MAG: hypothetical protein U9N84_02765 [Actinomycetota bacterium]|nr:hypothetical protein [Actinomycetota bacterium]